MSEFHTYDKAEWHLDGDYPNDLDESSAYTHTGLYLGWIIDRDLISDTFNMDFASEIAQFRNRELTAPALFQIMDGVFTDDLLNEEGTRFSREYFDFENGDYLSDYESLLTEQLPSLYHVKDSWMNFDTIAKRLNERLKQYRKRSRPRWWRFGSR